MYSFIDNTPLNTKKRYLMLKLMDFLPSSLRFPFAQLLGRSVFTDDYIKTKSLFIHIPKCAGMAVSYSLYNKPTTGHFTAKRCMWENSNLYNDMFKYTFVRNPYDRVQSAYYFWKKGGLSHYDKDFFESELVMYDTFEKFVMEWLSHENIYKKIHLVPQIDFITINGEIVVDFIGRQENLEHDFAFICEKIGVNKELGAFNKNEERNKDSMSEYTDEMKRKVYQVYKKDFELLDYDSNF